MLYNNKTGPFGISMFWELEAIKNPIDWWHRFQKEVPALGKLAIKLMSIPASSAASERNWSNFGFIQNIKRNRLTNERTFKLVSIYANLRLTNNQKLDDDIMDELQKNQLSLEIEINEEVVKESENENENEIIIVEESEESEIEN